MAAILKFSDGSTTVDFLTDPAFSMVRWSPAVAVRQPGDFNGRTPFGDVIEEMVITVAGSQVLADLAMLQGLLDQSARWARGEPVAPVLFHYKPTTGGEELRSVVMGSAGDAPMIELPDNLPLSPTIQMIDPVLVRFRRLGVWLGSVETTTDSSTAQTMPTVRTVGVADASLTGYPIRVRLEGVGQWNYHAYNSFLLMSSAHTSDISFTKIRLVGAIVHELSGEGFTSVNDAANKPSNGSTVLRFTAGGTGTKASASWNASPLDDTVRRWGVLLSYRNNNASISFDVTVEFQTRGGVYYLGPFTIPGGVSNPQFVFLGSLSVPAAVTSTTLYVNPSAGGGTIDFDLIAYVALDSPDTSRVIEIGGSNYSSSLSNDDLIFDHRLLSDISPQVYFDETGDVIMPYEGDATVILRGPIVYMTWLATGGSGNPTHWRPSNSGGTVFTNKFYLTTRKMHLIPR